MKKKSK